MRILSKKRERDKNKREKMMCLWCGTWKLSEIEEKSKSIVRIYVHHTYVWNVFDKLLIGLEI